MQPFVSRISRRAAVLGMASIVALGSGTALAANAIYNFTSLATGTTYVVGDVIAAANATIELTQFQWSNGTWTAGGIAEVVASTNAAGSAPRELNLNNINVRVIPNTQATSATFKYAWFGGNVNLGVNGNLSNVLEPMLWNGIVLGGASVTVTQVNIAGGYRGTVTITPQAGTTIERFGTGGQEYYIDDVRHDW
jgi:hypothetical protein